MCCAPAARRSSLKIKSQAAGKNRLLEITDGAQKWGPELISEAPGRPQVSVLLLDRFGRGSLSVTTTSAEKASFHSRPFGLADNRTVS
jgi:hypothetical protein